MTRAVRADWEAAHALTTADTPCIDSAKCNRSPVASHALTIIICAGGPHEAAVAPFGARLHAPCALRTIYLHRSCAFAASIPCNAHRPHESRHDESMKPALASHSPLEAQSAQALCWSLQSTRALRSAIEPFAARANGANGSAAIAPTRSSIRRAALPVGTRLRITHSLQCELGDDEKSPRSVAVYLATYRRNLALWGARRWHAQRCARLPRASGARAAHVRRR